ncbi:unnamed protein product, partial [Symbiodinium sp. CCMP2456]
ARDLHGPRLAAHGYSRSLTQCQGCQRGLPPPLFRAGDGAGPIGNAAEAEAGAPGGSRQTGWPRIASESAAGGEKELRRAHPRSVSSGALRSLRSQG